MIMDLNKKELEQFSLLLEQCYDFDFSGDDDGMEEVLEKVQKQVEKELAIE